MNTPCFVALMTSLSLLSAVAHAQSGSAASATVSPSVPTAAFPAEAPPSTGHASHAQTSGPLADAAAPPVSAASSIATRPTPSVSGAQAPSAATAPYESYSGGSVSADYGRADERVSRAYSVDAGARGESSHKGEQCALGDLCIGPVLTPGIPHIVGAGVHVRQGDYVGFGFDYQALPTMTFSDTSVSSGLLTLEARIYPTGGPFWFGAGFSSQTVNARYLTDLPTGDSVPVTGQISIPAFKLGLGVMGRNGFILGIDAALAIPLGDKSVSVDEPEEVAGLPAAQVDEARAEVEDSLRSVADALPLGIQLNLLRIGYLF